MTAGLYRLTVALLTTLLLLPCVKNAWADQAGSTTQTSLSQLRQMMPPPATAQNPAAPIPPAGEEAWVVNLGTFATPPRRVDLPEHALLDSHSLVLVPHTLDDRKLHRLRLGFFADRQAASRAAASLDGLFPGAWVARMATQGEDSYTQLDLERAAPTNAVENTLPNGTKTVAAAVPVTTKRAIQAVVEAMPPATRAGPAPTTETVALLPPPPTTPPAPSPVATNKNQRQAPPALRRARLALARDDLEESRLLLNELLESGPAAWRPEVLELKALLLERSGSIELARAAYETWLNDHPDHENTARVRQRLAGLLTAREVPRKPLAKATAKKKPEWQVHGSFSQFYRRDTSVTDLEGSSTDQSALNSDLYLSARRRGGDLDLRGEFSGGYLHDFLDDGNDSETDVGELYFQAISRTNGLSATLGRQSQSSGGILGRFDGSVLGYQLTPRSKANIVAGWPVDSSTTSGLNTDKSFFGLNLDLGPFEGLDMNVFGIDQQVSGLVDRRAVGVESRYFTPELSMFGLLDYDVEYSRLNTFLLLGTWSFTNRSTLSLSVDRRISPFMSTSNALIGQSVSSLKELKSSYSTDEIKQLARDRSPVSRSLTLSGSQPLSERFQFSMDLTRSSLGGTPASGGVDATAESGNEWFWAGRVIGSNLFTKGDTSILGLRWADTFSAETLTLNLDTRYPLSPAWRINPRLRLDFRSGANGAGSQTTFRPSLRTDYLWRRRHRFEFEAGGERSTDPLSESTTDSHSYYINLGYRRDF